MKAEERKTLESNTLAESLNQAVEGLKEGPSRSTLFWVGVLVAVVLAFLLFRYFYLSSEATASGRWVKLDEVVFPEQMQKLLEDKDLEGTAQGRILKLKDARAKLSLGLRDLGSSPSIASDRIREAVKQYEDLLPATNRLPLLQQEALWGAAKGSEALGDLETARKYYKKLTEDYPTTALGKDARKQLDRLDSTSGEKEADELAKMLLPKK